MRLTTPYLSDFLDDGIISDGSTSGSNSWNSPVSSFLLFEEYLPRKKDLFDSNVSIIQRKKASCITLHD